MKTYTIKVTAEDIKKGLTKDTRHCPVARAFRRETKKKSFDVGRYEIEIGENNFMIKLPKKASKFIGRFDDGEKVKPFSFRIKL